MVLSMRNNKFEHAQLIQLLLDPFFFSCTGSCAGLRRYRAMENSAFKSLTVDKLASYLADNGVSDEATKNLKDNSVWSCTASC